MGGGGGQDQRYAYVGSRATAVHVFIGQVFRHIPTSSSGGAHICVPYLTVLKAMPYWSAAFAPSRDSCFFFFFFSCGGCPSLS